MLHKVTYNRFDSPRGFLGFCPALIAFIILELNNTGQMQIVCKTSTNKKLTTVLAPPITLVAIQLSFDLREFLFNAVSLRKGLSTLCGALDVIEQLSHLLLPSRMLLRLPLKMVKHLSLFHRLFVALISVLILLFNQGRANELNKNNGIMLPNKPQQIVNASDNVTITCIFVHSAEIKWIYPEYLFKTPEVFIFEKSRCI